MKIGIYDPYLDDLGGGEKYMMTVAQYLSENHDVNVFWDRKEDIHELLQRFSLDLSKVTLQENIFSRSVSFWRRIVKSREFDAIIILSDGSIPFVLSKKLFVHIQQPLPFVKLDPKDKWKASRVSKFFCNSLYTKCYVDETFGVKSLVLYPPVDIMAKKIKKENIILTVGRLRVKDVVTKRGKSISGVGDYKKHSIMIDVFKEMITDGLKGWRFLIAVSVKNEDKEIFEEMKKSIKNFPIEFLVNKTNEQLWDIYAKSKIYWHASGFGEDIKLHPEFAEHFGISTVEAMGAGAVPVVINAGGQLEIVSDGQDGFLWNTLEELKGKTKLLIEDDSVLHKLAKNAQERARRFGKERFKKELYEIIF